MKRILPFLAACILISCGQQQERKELYCGIEMSGFEVMDFKTMANRRYNYTDEDKALHTQLTEGVNQLLDNKEDVQISFAFKENDTIALFIIAPSDKEIVEKISCYLLKEDFKGFPKNRNLLFYTNEHDTLVAGVKSKK